MKVKEYGAFDVTDDRSDYIGGSDLPIIMGISTFKRRFDLLLEKAKLKDNDFQGNRFTEYGNIMEPKIREHINCTYSTQFVPNRVIDGDIRCHTDGFNGECVLEIKTTSDIHSAVDGYKVYLVQIVKYMEENEVTDGILAVYNRPEDFDTNFNADRLQVFEISLDDYKSLLAKVNDEIDRFRADLARLKENPLLTEQDFLPANSDLVSLSNKVVKFESQLAMLKEIEQQCKDAKKQLYTEMQKHGVKSFSTPNGTKITLVAETPGSTKKVTEFDTEAFKEENPAMYGMYLHEVEKKTAGKSGYVKITVPKG